MTAPMSEVDELRERVEGLTGPDRSVDAELAEALRTAPAGAFRMHGLGDGGMFGVGAYKQWFAPEYTASLDAVLALVAEKLPAMLVELYSHTGGWSAILREDPFTPSDHATGATPALALLSALLSALPTPEGTSND